jgi:LppX_LprAFG lipoprotein
VPVRADIALRWREGDPLPLPRRRFLNLLGAGSVLAVGACGPVENEAITREATPTATPTPAALLELARKRLAETPTVHFALDVQGETFIDSGRNIRLLGAEGEVQRPDRVRAAFQAEVMNRAISLQLVSIGDKSWTTNILTGEWENAPMELAYQPDILFSTQDGIEPVMGRVKDVERLTDEEIEGRSTYHLQATVDESAVGPLTYYTISGSPITVDLWIDQETHDLLRAQLSEPPGPERSNPAVWTLNLSHHGEDISIEPPD